jgi:electron transfer flavoprotein beta subunit
MEIVVCAKQVPDTESLIKVGADGKSIDAAGIKWVLNFFDETGVEEALRIKEKAGGTITLVSVGPQRTVEALRQGMAMGADKSVLVDDPAAEGSDPAGIAKILAAALKNIPYDIIVCGFRTTDDESSQVGLMLAEQLGIPHLPPAIKLEISGDHKAAKIETTVEGGMVTIESSLPAVITTGRGLNEPRMASLPGIMKAKKKPIDTKKLADLGVDAAAVGAAAAKTKIQKMTLPPERKAGQIIEGASIQEKAGKMAALLKDEAKVL